MTGSARQRQTRRPFTVRLAPAGHAEVERLAEVETEGNASAMVRRLLAEALAVRAKRAARGA